jgi:putative flippase GtrA
MNIRRIIKSKIFIEASKYFIVGGGCTVLDFVLLFGLTHFLNINYLLSSVISFMSGTVLNYFLCTYWIFKTRVVANRYHEFFYYTIITGVGLLINTLVIWCCTDLLSIYYMISKACAAFVTFGWNFGARKYFLHTIR